MSQYSYEIFFRTALCAASIVAIVLISGYFEIRKEDLKFAIPFLVFALTGIFLAAVDPLFPFENGRGALRTVEALCAVLGAVSLLTLWAKRRKRGASTDFGAFGSTIIDTLREHVVVFDANLRVLAGERNPLRAYGLEPGTRASVPEVDGLSSLKESIERGERAEGSFDLDGVPYSYRFGPLRFGRGFFLTLLDVSQERAMIDSLRERNELLSRRKAFLESSSGTEEARVRAETQNRVSARIQDIVAAQLSSVRELIRNGSEIDPIIETAEASMAEIRQAVAALASQRRRA